MRARPSSLSLVALIVGALSTAPLAAQEAVLLRYHFQEGQTFRIVTTTESETSHTFQSMEQSVEQSMTQGTLMEVLSVDAEGAARIRYTTESVRVSMKTPMGLLEYDSSQPDATVPQALRPFALNAGVTYLMTMTPDGSVRDVTGGEELLERMLDGMSLPPGMTKESVREDMEAQFGDEAMARSLAQNFSGYPADAVAVGDSWTRVGRMPGIPLVMETVSTVTGRGAGTVTVSAESTLSSDGESVMAMAGVAQRYEVTGTSSGVTEIEAATGVYLRMRAEMTMNGSVTISASGRDMTIPMSSHTVTTLERVQGG